MNAVGKSKTLTRMAVVQTRGKIQTRGKMPSVTFVYDGVPIKTPDNRDF